MKKFINQVDNFVDEMLEGILYAHPKDLKSINNDLRCIVSNPGGSRTDKVGIVTGGGSGHLPLFLGYVGEGMLDGCAVGDVFQSPSSEQIFQITQEVDTGKGVLYLYGNYGGDIMNFDMRRRLPGWKESRSRPASAPMILLQPERGKGETEGVAGIFFLYKIAGAKAAEGASLEEVKMIAIRAGENTRTMGVATSPCIVPQVGKPSFTIGENEMEIGMGIHGETGIHRGILKTADEVVQQMMNGIMDDLPYKSGDEVSVLVNGLGATPKEEMYVIYRKIHMILKEKDINPLKSILESLRLLWKWQAFPYP